MVLGLPVDYPLQRNDDVPEKLVFEGFVIPNLHCKKRESGKREEKRSGYKIREMIIRREVIR